jgi:hypothetical protein
MSQRKRTIPRQESNGQSQQSGSGLFKLPEFALPDLPTNLTDLSDDYLMELFSEFTAWQNYAAVQQAEAEVGEATAEANQRYVEAQAMVRDWGTKDKVTVAKAEMASDPEVSKARDAVLGAYARRKLTQVVYSNCERCVFVISRELSRRIGNVGYERRQNRWNP